MEYGRGRNMFEHNLFITPNSKRVNLLKYVQCKNNNLI